MKGKSARDKKAIRREILDSALASFRIEGIHIPKPKAEEVLKKIEATLER
jgi:hypothetical protein